MIKKVLNLSNLKTLTLDISVSDEEVAKIWRMNSPLINKNDNTIEINKLWEPKQLAAAEIRKNKREILSNIYLTNFEKISLLYNARDGEVYKFINHAFQLIIDKNKEALFLRHIDQNKRKTIYKDGMFYTTKNKWLMASSQKFSKSKCKGIRMHSDMSLLKPIDIKNHQIIAAMFWGKEAIEHTFGNGAELQINHRNLDNDDNRLENLEIVTARENMEHRKILRKYIDKKLAEILSQMGVTDYTIIKNDKHLTDLLDDETR